MINLSFIPFAFSQVATPGPANMAMMATGARFGFRAALPFVAGVILGKQLIIWPIGYGIMEVASQIPLLFEILKFLSALYIIWLAWRVANMRLSSGEPSVDAPGFWSGLLVHPLNPKAWAMILVGFTNFVESDTTTFYATLYIAASLLIIQIICHPIWTLFGDRIAKFIIGKKYERVFMWFLALVTVIFVLMALFA
jgi:threonine/homoserine/homoserine lactone efflux protein|tara:strand:+ start:360 stop:947 length:588 start_codon:yes stop_codon:yes gene_type:complete